MLSRSSNKNLEHSFGVMLGKKYKTGIARMTILLNVIALYCKTANIQKRC